MSDGVNDVLQQKALTPVKADFYRGITSLPVYFAWATTYSPHPYMGALFINYCLTPTLQTVLANFQDIRILDNLGVSTAIEKVLPGGNAAEVPTSDMESLYHNPQEYLTSFNSLWPPS